MHKKLTTACFALLAFAAFALPTAAQATNTPVITHPTGTVLSLTGKTCTGITGVCIKGHNVGNTLMLSTTGSTQLTCTTAVMTGALIKNETGNVQGNIQSATFTGTGPGSRCTGFANAAVDPLGLGTGAGQGWCVKSNTSMAEDEVQVFGGQCTEAAKKIKFLLTPEVGGECEYESTTTTAAKGTLTTDVAPNNPDAIIHVPRTGHTATEDAGFTKIRDTTLFSLCPSSSGLQMSFTLETDTANTEPLYFSN